MDCRVSQSSEAGSFPKLNDSAHDRFTIGSSGSHSSAFTFPTSGRESGRNKRDSRFQRQNTQDKPRLRGSLVLRTAAGARRRSVYLQTHADDEVFTSVCVCVRVCARGNAYACTRACAYCVQNRLYRQRRGATYACPGLKSAQCVHKRLRYSLRRPVLELGHASLIREKRLRLKCRTVRVPLFLPWDNFQSLSRMLHTDIRNAAVRA